MKLKIGQRLQSIREDRKMSQLEFAEILSMSQSAYSRLERGETQLSFEELTRVADKLDVPVLELLPETAVFQQLNNGNNEKGSGITFFGDCIFNTGTSDATHQLEKENGILSERIAHLQEKIALLEKQIDILEKGQK